MAGLLRPTSGEVRAEPALEPPQPPRPLWRWRGRDLVSRVGTVFQDPEHQIVTGTVRDELTIGPRRAGAPEAAASARADELLERLGLAKLAGANPYTLSGGEKRRLSVATAIATSPRVVVADEPTFGQDSRTWAELVGLLGDLRDAGCGLLLVTHAEALVDALADRTVTMTAPPR
jgi:energy-coupling factor transport system ATP-binding protein